MFSLCALFLGKTLEVFSLDVHFKRFRTDLAKPEANLAFVQAAKKRFIAVSVSPRAVRSEARTFWL